MQPTPAQLFLARVQSALADDTFLLLRLRFDAAPQTDIRLVRLKNGPALSFVAVENRKAITRNLPVPEGIAELTRKIETGCTAWLETTQKNFQLIAPPGQRARYIEHKRTTPAPQPALARQHDAPKQTRLATATNWLTELGLTDERGKPLPGRADKLRQVERYSDLLAHLVRDCGWKESETITVADMGCGKGYLTFAAWHLLRRQLKLDATLIGLDANPELIAGCTTAAENIGADKISFRAGQISDADLTPCDILIALHACNDATDAAIRRGIETNAKLIVVAPCCHKDVRRALDATAAGCDPLRPLLEHGIFAERFAEWLTDGLRVLALEAAGWRVTTAEFIAAEHTPKNLLIAAIHGNTEARRTAAAAQLAAIKTWAALGPLPLDPAPNFQ